MDDLVSQEACGSYRILPPNPNRDLSRTGSIRDVESDYYTVEDFVLEEGYDYLKRLSNGMYSGRLLTHNILTKTIKTTYYDYQDEFDEIHSLESYPLNTDNLLSRKMAALAFRYNVAQSQRLQGSDIFNKIWLHRRSLLWQRNAIRGEVTVPGRTDRRVGQVIDLKIPTIEPRSQADKDFDIYDNHLSGRWLITAINHRITRTEHKMTMQIAKDSLSKEIKK
jgi:hypothetical protein